MKSILFIGLGGLATVLVSGCGERQDSAPQDSLTETPGPSDSDSASPGTDPPNTDTNSEPKLLEGRWGMLVSGATKQVGLPLIKTALAIDDNYYLVEIAADDHGRLTTRETFCASYWRNNTGLYNTVMPQAFIDQASVVERVVEPTNGKPGDPWRTNDSYAVYGARLADLVNDPLPVANPSAAIGLQPCDQVNFGEACDGDEDGHPGVTFISTGAFGCELYAASRVHAGLDGAVVDNSFIAGTLWSAGMEMNVLDASTVLCREMNLKSVDILDRCPQLFNFIMMRLADDADCAEVMMHTSCDEHPVQCVGDEDWPLNPPNVDWASCS